MQSLSDITSKFILSFCDCWCTNCSHIFYV